MNTPQCPQCRSSAIRKHGQHLGKQRWFCNACGYAFTGDVYARRPEDEIRPVKHENKKLLKIVAAALSMRKAQQECLQHPSGKARAKQCRREEKFDALIDKYIHGRGDVASLPVADATPQAADSLSLPELTANEPLQETPASVPNGAPDVRIRRALQRKLFPQ